MADRRRSTGVVRSRTNGKACCTCHRRKVKCDILTTNGAPCTNCRTQSRSDCRLYVRDGPRRRETRSTTSIDVRASSEGVRSGNATPLLTPLSANTTPGASRPSTLHSPAFNTQPQEAEAEAENQEGVIGKQHKSRPPSSSSAEDETSETRILSEFLAQEVQVHEISYSMRLYFIGTEFSTLNHLIRQRPKLSQQGILHFGSHPTRRRPPTVPTECLRLPAKKIVRELIEVYFSRVNNHFPIVYEADFMSTYEGKEPGRPVSLLLLNSILFVAAHCLTVTRPDMAKLAAMFYNRARQLFEMRYEEHREPHVQAALLLTWNCDQLEDVLTNWWYWIGFATRTMYGIGMHRDSSASRIKPTIKKFWVRLWWTLYQFDVMVSAAHGRPMSIDLDQSDVPELSHEHFEGVPNCSADFAVNHTRLCLIFAKAMKQRTSLRATASEREEATQKADAALADFLLNLPESLKLENNNAATAAYETCLLHLTYNHTLLLLHRPQPQGRPTSSSGDEERISPPPTNENASSSDPASVSICNEALASIAAIFESLRTRDMLGALWIPCAYILFAALAHVSTHPSRRQAQKNPIVEASFKRLCKTFMTTLEALTKKWVFARSLLLCFQTVGVVCKTQCSGKGAPGDKHSATASTGAEMAPASGHEANGSSSAAETSAQGNAASASAHPIDGALGGVIDGVGNGYGPGFHPGTPNLPFGNLDMGGFGWSMGGDQAFGGQMDMGPYNGTQFVNGPGGMMRDPVTGLADFEVPLNLELLLAGIGTEYGAQY